MRQDGTRGLEILEWLEKWNTDEVGKHGKERVESYVVIDDDVKDIIPYIKPKSCIIHTNVRKGLTESDLEKIKSYFKRNR